MNLYLHSDSVICFHAASELETLKNDKQVQKLEKDLVYEKKKNNELLSKISIMAQQATRLVSEY